MMFDKAWTKFEKWMGEDETCDFYAVLLSKI